MARRRATGARFRDVVLLGSVLLSGAAPLARDALANPKDPNVVSGDVAVVQDGDYVEVRVSSERGIIDWGSFSIGAGETTRFIQPSSSSITLNRDRSGTISRIDGNLFSNGRIFIINPNGVVFGSTARVDVSGLVATTSDIKNSDFLADRFRFDQIGTVADAAVINEGSVTVREAGFAALVAPVVRNDGVIQARLGRVSMGAGKGFVLDLYGDQLITFKIDDAPVEETASENAFVENTGRIIADGGVVSLGANAIGDVMRQVVNVQGEVRANAVRREGGKVVLFSTGPGDVTVGGKIEAKGIETDQVGGTVTVTGQRIHVAEGAVVDVSGPAGGGSVRIGGDYQGGGDLRRVEATVVDRDTRIDASANQNGDGGTAIVWSDDYTRFDGLILAEGGAQGGDGGLIETSGLIRLDVNGNAHASAPAGAAGMWLLDPHDVTITNTTSGGAFGGGNPDIFTPTMDSATVSVAAINAALNAGTDVTVTTGGTGSEAGDITVASAIAKTAGGNATLTLDAAGNVIQTTSITSTTGQLNLSVIAGGTFTVNTLIDTNGGDVTVNASSLNMANAGQIDTSGGSGSVNLTLTGGATSNLSTITTGSGSIQAASTAQMNIRGTRTISSGSGNISLTGTAGLLLNNGADVTTGGAGTVTLASSGTVEIGAGGSQAAVVSAVDGDVTITAGALDMEGNGQIDTSGGSGSVDITATGGTISRLSTITTDSGSIQAAATGPLRTRSQGAIDSGSGDISLSSSADITVNGPLGAGTTGDITLSADTGGTGSAANSLAVNGAVGNAAAGDVTMSGSAFDIQEAVQGSGVLTLRASGSGQVMGIGAAAGVPRVSNSELANLTGFSRQDFEADGGIDIAAPTFTGAATLKTAADITVSGAIATGGNDLDMVAGGGVDLANPITTGGGDLLVSSVTGTALKADIGSAGGSVTILGPLLVDAAPRTIGTGGGGLSIATMAPSPGGGALTLDAGSGGVSITGAADTGGGAVDITGGSINVGTSLKAGNVTFRNGTVTASGLDVLSLDASTTASAEMAGIVNGMTGADAAIETIMPLGPLYTVNTFLSDGGVPPSPPPPPPISSGTASTVGNLDGVLTDDELEALRDEVSRLENAADTGGDGDQTTTLEVVDPSSSIVLRDGSEVSPDGTSILATDGGTGGLDAGTAIGGDAIFLSGDVLVDEASAALLDDYFRVRRDLMQSDNDLLVSAFSLGDPGMIDFVGDMVSLLGDFDVDYFGAIPSDAFNGTAAVIYPDLLVFQPGASGGEDGDADGGGRGIGAAIVPTAFGGLGE